MPEGPKRRVLIRLTGAAVVSAFAVSGVASADTASTGGAAYGSKPKVARAHSASDSEMEKIAQCESGGDPTLVSKSGVYRGKYMFNRDAWRIAGGKGDPARASETEQDRRAKLLYAKVGPSAWPNCA